MSAVASIMSESCAERHDPVVLASIPVLFARASTVSRSITFSSSTKTISASLPSGLTSDAISSVSTTNARSVLFDEQSSLGLIPSILDSTAVCVLSVPPELRGSSTIIGFIIIPASPGRCACSEVATSSVAKN